MSKEANQFKKIEKVVVNTGIGRLSQQPNFEDKVLPAITQDFAAITGQKPSARPARISISGFKLRKGLIIGLKATLRRKRMEEFLNKISKVVLPRVRDFGGINPKNVDREGNLSFGIRDHLVFPEILPEHSRTNFGVEVTVVPKNTEVANREEAMELYKSIGIPFAKPKQK